MRRNANWKQTSWQINAKTKAEFKGWSLDATVLAVEDNESSNKPSASSWAEMSVCLVMVLEKIFLSSPKYEHQQEITAQLPWIEANVI